MSLATWPRPLRPYLPKVICSGCERPLVVGVDAVWQLDGEPAVLCDTCLALILGSDEVRAAARAPRALPPLRPVERTEDEESALDQSVDQLRHLSQHEQFPMYGCSWCLGSGRFLR